MQIIHQVKANEYLHKVENQNEVDASNSSAPKPGQRILSGILQNCCDEESV